MVSIHQFYTSGCASPSKAVEASTIRNKWKQLGLNAKWLDAHTEDVSFLVRTKLIYSIVGFQNSTLNGREQNQIKKKQDGLWIKKEGQWVPVAQIRKEMDWNSKVNAVVSKHCEFQQWNYFSDQGLVPIHSAYEADLTQQVDNPRDQHRMHPVAQVSAQEMQDLLAHAQQFYSGPNETTCKCLIQFVTHPNTSYTQPYLQNLNAQMNVHCGIRLILADGSVYSFGLGGSFQEHLLKSSASQSVATINGQPKILDYMEFQKYEQRLVTTVPLNESQAEEILNQLHFYRANGVRFNILRQNCVRFATHLLHIAGVHVNPRISLLETAWRSFPNVEHLPLIGKKMGIAKQWGQKAYQKTATKIPAVVKEIFAYLATVMCYLPHQLVTLLTNLGLWLVVGGKVASTNHCLDLEKTTDAGQLENFDTLVSSFLDDTSTYVYHSSIFIHWQLNQKTTAAYGYSGQPCMNILPPASVEEQTFSTQKKSQLKAMYESCIH